MPPAFSSAEAQCLQRCETLHIDSVVNPCAVQLIFCDYARKGIEIVNFEPVPMPKLSALIVP